MYTKTPKRIIIPEIIAIILLLLSNLAFFFAVFDYIFYVNTMHTHMMIVYSLLFSIWTVLFLIYIGYLLFKIIKKICVPHVFNILNIIISIFAFVFLGILFCSNFIHGRKQEPIDILIIISAFIFWLSCLVLNIYLEVMFKKEKRKTINNKEEK